MIEMAAIYFYFPPNPYGRYFFVGLMGLVVVWLVYALVKDILEVARSEADFEIIEENGKWFAIKYLVTRKGKKYEVGREEIRSGEGGNLNGNL